ncbi:MAG: reverse transcriptase domain-containing protein [Candidatus ainarchaeum sp.]|nr:reverse transcriptase domain-containing protein [Candidatus ainarchaeum sp.]MDD3975738.1 reverse transcriptase domain-containing protein [Candidatus ainarchaeum sp.]
MKSYNNLWSEFISFRNLFLAFKKARKVKPNSKQVLDFSFNLEKNLFSLQKELIENKYSVSAYNVFTIFEPKERIIKSLPFKDRVVQHALINIIEPIFEKSFIYDSFACRKNKGIHFGLNRLKKVIQNKSCLKYFLKADIKKYFFSIDHSILKEIIFKKIKDKSLQNLISIVIDSDCSNLSINKGVPIGNLTSQLFANIYLNEFDQYIKHNLFVSKYFRYVDDFLIFSNSKKDLNKILYCCRVFLKKELKLKIPFKKANIYLTNNGVDFIGYVIYPNFIKVRTKSLKRFYKVSKKNIYLYDIDYISKVQLESSICSFLGFFKFSSSYNAVINIFNNNIIFYNYFYLFNKIYFSF